MGNLCYTITYITILQDGDELKSLKTYNQVMLD